MAKIIKQALIAAAVAFVTIYTAGTFAPGLIGTMGAAAGTTAFAFAKSMAILTFVGTSVAGGIAMLTSRGIDATRQNFGTKVAGRGAQVARQIVYGKCRVGGTIVKMHVSGNDKSKLHLAIVLAGHEIESLEGVFFGETLLTTTSHTISHPDGGSAENYKKVTNSDFVNSGNDNAIDSGGTLVQFSFMDGSQTRRNGLAATNSSRFPATAKFERLAYVYMEVVYDPEKLGGLPAMHFLIKGKKVYDPRTSSTAWSDNPALHVRDFLMDTTYGLKATSSEINDTTTAGGFQAAANACEVSVDLNSDGSETEERFTSNGFVNAAAAPDGVIEGILSACAGKLTYTNGKFNIFVGTAQTPSLTVTDEDILEAQQIATKQGNGELYNGIKALFVDSTQLYNGAETPVYINSTHLLDDTPNRQSSDSANYKKILETQLPFTVTHTMAQRLQKIQYFRQREASSLSLLTSLEYMRLQPGDWVRVTNSRLSYSSKAFEVVSTSMEFGENDGQIYAATRLALQEVSAATYNYIFSEYSTPQTAGTNIPSGDLSIAAPTAGTLSNRTRSEGPTAKIDIIVSWTNATDLAIQGTEVQYREDGASNFDVATIAVRGSTSAVISGVQVGKTYNVRIRHFSFDNVYSSYATYSDITIPEPDTISAPTNLAATTNKPFFIELTWTNPTNGNYRAVEVHFSATDGFTPDSTTLLNSYYGEVGKQKKVILGVSAGLSYGVNYYFRARAVNVYGTASAYTAQVTGKFVQAAAGDLAANSVTAVEINVANLSSVSSDLGSVTAGSIDINSGQFTVSSDGAMVAQSASIDGSVISSSGTIGGFTLASNKLSAGADATAVSLSTADGIHLGATAFGSAPFRVSTAGALTATNATITGAVNASSGTYSGQVAVGSVNGTITVIDGNDTDFRLFTNATLDADTNQFLPDDSSFKVGNDGRVFASDITIYNSDGDVLLSPAGLGAAALNDISTTSGSVVSTVGGTVNNSTSEITLTTSSASESFTITSKVAIDDNNDLTQFFSGASTSSTANAEAQLTGVEILVDYFVKPDGGSYDSSPNVTKTVTIINSGTPTSTQIRVGGFDRGASYSGSLTRYFSIPQDFGGALEIISNNTTPPTSSKYVVTTASLGSSLFPSAQTYKIKIVVRVVEDGTTTAISGSTTPPSSDNTTTGIRFDGGNSDERHYEITGSGLIKNSDNNFTSGSQNLLASGGTVSGNLTVTGDFTVQGTTTTIDTATLNVEDKNITLNYSTGDSSGSADGSGITIQDAVDASTDATLNWNATNDRWEFSHQAKTPSLMVGSKERIDSDGDLNNIRNANISGDIVAPLTTGHRLGAVRIGGDGDILLYESATNEFTIRSGTTSAYKYFTFNDDGSFNVLNGGITLGGDSSLTKESPVFTLTDSSSSRTLQLIVDDNNSVVRSSGTMLLQSGGSVTALTLDSSQNATLANHLGVNTAASSSLVINAATSTANHLAAQFENSNTADSFGIVVKAGNDANDYAADFRKRDNTSILKLLGSGNATFSGSIDSGAITVDGEVSVAPSSGTAKVRLTSLGVGSEVFSVNGQRPGVSNTGFAIRNETDSRNDFMLDGSGNATFSGKASVATSLSDGNLTVHANSDSVPGLSIMSDANHGMHILHRATEGNFSFLREVGGTKTEFLNIARATGDATFAGSVTGAGIIGDPYLQAKGADGAMAVFVDSKSSFDGSNTLNAPFVIWREADGSNIAGIRGYVDTGGNKLALGTGFFDQEVTITPNGMSVAGTITSGAITASADSTITTAGFTRLNINSTRTSGNIGGVDFQASGTIKGQIYGTVDGQIKVATNGSTVAATFDASQNLLMGTTETDIGFTDSGAGFSVSPLGAVQVARSSVNELLYLNKLDNDGDVIRFSKDGAEVGTIAVSSSDLTLDVSGSIVLNADATGVVDFKDGATHFGRIENASSDFKIESRVQDKDIVLVGNDGGIGIEALRLDMHQGGEADFAGAVKVGGAIVAHQTNRGVFEYASNIFKIRSYGATAGSGAFTISTGGGGGSADTVALSIDSSGLVDIGSNGSGSAGASKQLLSLVNPNGTAGTAARLWMSGTNATTRGAYIEAEAQSTANDHDLIFATSASSATPSERLRIDSSGNIFATNSSSNLVIGNSASGSIYLGGGNTNTSNIYFQTGSSVALTLDSSNNATFAATVTAPTLISGAYGAGGTAGDGFRINSTDIYGQKDSVDKIHLSAPNGNAYFAGSVTVLGNTGVGIAIPDSKLHVHAASAGSVTALAGTTLTVEGNSNNYLSLLSPDANLSALVYGSPSSTNNASINSSYNGGLPYLNFNTGGQEALRIDANRKLLVGDSASHTSDLLQIETPASGGGHGIQIRRNDSNNDQQLGRLLFGNNTDTDLAQIAAKTDGQVDNGALFFSTQATSGALTERMRIDSSFQITFKLNGGASSHIFNYNEDGGEIQLLDNAGSTATLIDQSSNATRVLELINGSNLALGLGGSNTTGSIIFYKAGFSEAMRLNASGNLGVGLGNASPSSRLTVSGAFNATTAGSKPSITGTGIYGGGIGFIDTNVSGIYTDTAGANLRFFTNQTSSDTAASRVGMTLTGSNEFLVNVASTFNNAQASVLAASGKQALTLQTTSDGNSLIQGFDSAGNLEFQVTGGGNVYASYRLGVGTSTPGSALHISGDYASNQSDIQLTNTNNGRSWRIGDGIAAVTSKLVFFDGTAGAVRMVLDSSGNLGLGTVTPFEMLELDKSSGNTFVRFDKAGTFKGLVGITDSAGSGSSDSLAGDMILRSQTRVLLDTGGTTRVSVDSSGNVNFSGRITARDNTYQGGIILSPASGSAYITANRATASTGQAGFGYYTAGAMKWVNYLPHSSDILTWYSAATASNVMTLSTSGTLFVNEETRIGQNTGTIFNQTSVSGINASGGGYFQMAAADATVMYVNRIGSSSQGQVVGIYEAGVAVGGISSFSDTIQFGQGNVYLKMANASDTITPANGNGTDNDNELSIGTTTARIKNIVVGSQVRLESGTGGTTDKIVLKTTDNADESKFIRTNAYYVEFGGHANEGFKFIDTHGNTLLAMYGGANALAKQAVFAGNVTAFSDERLKSDVETLDGSKVLQMRGVSYTRDGKAGSGVIAQELEKHAPELVFTSNDEMQTKSVAYANLTGYLIEAVKMQAKQIAKLEEAIKELKDGSNEEQ